MLHTDSFLSFFLSEPRTSGSNLLTGRSSCCETDREIDWSYSCRAPSDTEVRYKPPPPQISVRGRLHTPPPHICISVYVCVCVFPTGLCVISRSLEALSSALISLTDVTPAWPRPQQSHQGGNDGAFLWFLEVFIRFPQLCFRLSKKYFLDTDRAPSHFLGSHFRGKTSLGNLFAVEMKLIWMKSFPVFLPRFGFTRAVRITNRRSVIM